MTIKWFFEDIMNHLFHFLDENHQHNECKIDNSSNNYSLVGEHHEHVLFKSNKTTIIFESLFSILYFMTFIIVYRLSLRHRSKLGAIFSKQKSKIFNIIFALIFLLFIFVILSQTLKLNSFKLIIECESFFKNSFQSVSLI